MSSLSTCVTYWRSGVRERERSFARPRAFAAGERERRRSASRATPKESIFSLLLPPSSVPPSTPTVKRSQSGRQLLRSLKHPPPSPRTGCSKVPWVASCNVCICSSYYWKLTAGQSTSREFSVKMFLGSPVSFAMSAPNVFPLASSGRVLNSW